MAAGLQTRQDHQQRDQTQYHHDRHQQPVAQVVVHGPGRAMGMAGSGGNGMAHVADYDVSPLSELVVALVPGLADDETDGKVKRDRVRLSLRPPVGLDTGPKGECGPATQTPALSGRARPAPHRRADGTAGNVTPAVSNRYTRAGVFWQVREGPQGRRGYSGVKPTAIRAAEVRSASSSTGTPGRRLCRWRLGNSWTMCAGWPRISRSTPRTTWVTMPLTFSPVNPSRGTVASRSGGVLIFSGMRRPPGQAETWPGGQGYSDPAATTDPGEDEDGQGDDRQDDEDRPQHGCS